MECLKCGVDIGNAFGLCSVCRKISPEPSASERHKQFENLRQGRQLPLWKSVVLWLTHDFQRILNLFGALMLVLFCYFFVAGMGCSSTTAASFKRPPGIVVPEDPVQVPASGELWEYGGWTFDAKAAFTIRARVLVAARFSLGGGSDISPFDFTLGWGPMSDTAVLRKLVFTHGFRLVYWVPVDGQALPVDRDVIGRHVSNMHAIPASPEIYQQLKDIRVDDVVTFEGYLVYATSGSRFWNSSLTRDDIGDGACEVMWIQRVSVEPSVVAE